MERYINIPLLYIMLDLIPTTDCPPGTVFHWKYIPYQDRDSLKSRLHEIAPENGEVKPMMGLQQGGTVAVGDGFDCVLARYWDQDWIA